MYRKIIVGYDGSEQARDAVALGKLVAENTGAQLVVAGVFRLDPLYGRDPHYRQAEAEHASDIEQAAAAAGAEPVAIPSSSAGKGLHDLAEELNADLVVIGSAHHGRLGQIVAGSVGMSLLHGSPCPVAIAPREYAAQSDGRLSEVTLGYDGSPEAELALQDAVELARKSQALLKVVAVAEPPVVAYGKGGGRDEAWNELMTAIEENTRAGLAEALQQVPGDVKVEGVVARDEPAAALAEIATADNALLVLGSRAYGPLRRVLLGSVSAELVRSAPCPVIIHPRPARSDTEPEELMSAGKAG